MALIDKLKAIADAVREKTGGTDALTLEQMVTEIEGIEAGGGLAYDMGEFVLDADGNGWNEIPHNLGVVPDFILVWTDEFAGTTNSYGTPTVIGFICMHMITGMSQRLTSAASYYPLNILLTQAKDSNVLSVGNPTSYIYTASADIVSSSTNKTQFATMHTPSTTYYRAGITYKYFVSKAWWNVGGVASAE